MKYFLLLCLSFSICFLSACQDDMETGVSTAFVKFFGEDRQEEGSIRNAQGVSVIVQEDGYLILGNTYGMFGNNTTDVLLFKTDIEGNELWRMEHEAFNIDSEEEEISQLEAVSFKLLSNGNVLLLATLNSSKVFLAEVSTTGSLVSSNIYTIQQGSIITAKHFIIDKLDGNIVVSGELKDNQTDKTSNIFVLYIDVNTKGALGKPKIFGVDVDASDPNQTEIDVVNKPEETVATNDGGAIIIGTGGVGNVQNVRVSKMDNNLGLQWDEVFGNGKGNQGKTAVVSGNEVLVAGTVKGISIQEGEDGSMVVSEDSSIDDDIYVFRISADLANLKHEFYFGGDRNESPEKVCLLADGSILITGSTNSFDSKAKDIFLAKFDANGNNQWIRTFGDQGIDSANDVQQTSDGGFVIVGTVQFGNNEMISLIKTDSQGELLD